LDDSTTVAVPVAPSPQAMLAVWVVSEPVSLKGVEKARV